jgi:hypothetical protein
MSRPAIPVAVVIAAALSIPVALLGLGLGVVGFNLFLRLSDPAEGSAAHKELAREVQQAVPNWMALETGKAALVAVLGAVLLIGAAGLFLRRPWARRLCLGYALVTLLLHSAYLALQFGYVRPAAQGIQERKQTAEAVRIADRGAKPPKLESPNDTAVVVGMVGAAGLFVAHAFFLLVVLRPGAGDRWLTGSTPRTDEVL